MISGECHCGAVSFELDAQLEWLTQCNCSICRRLGAVWAHAQINEIRVTAEEGATLAYSWGDKQLAFHTCKTCGSTTHWENLNPQESSFMAVNSRLADPGQISALRVRQFDGAETWEYLD